MKLIPAKGLIGVQALREAASTELTQIICLVRAALQAAEVAEASATAPGAYVDPVEIEAMFPDRVIVFEDGRYYQYPYTIDANNLVVLGAETEVIEQFVPVSLTMATPGDFMEAKDAEGITWDATLIRAGLSLNNVFYPDVVLREAAPLADGRPIFAKGDVEHTRGGGKDVRNIVGWISAPAFIEGAGRDTGRLQGRVNFSAATNLRELLADAWKRGKKDLAGFSIDAEGTAKTELREGRNVRVAQKITKFNSVDLIVEPGAGGALVRMVEAAPSEEETEMKLKQRLLEAIKTKSPTLLATINPDTITDEELEAKYREAFAQPTPAPAPTKKEDLAIGDDKPVTREELRMIESRANARVAIAAAKLPQAAKDKLAAEFSARERFAEADVAAAIKAEGEYLARFTESGRVQLGGLDLQVEDRSVKIAGMLDAFFDTKHKDHRTGQSFKECYIEMTGDRRVTGQWENVDRTRLAESVGAAFRESLDSTSFAFTLGTSITRRLIADYRDMGQYDVWRDACEVVPISDFRLQDRTRFGGYGDLPAVNQGAAYTSLSSPTDEHATYTPTKRGGTEDVTLEMIKNDDVGAIRRLPIKMSRSAKRTLAKFVLDFVRNNPAIYDTVTFFHASHGNLNTVALSAAELGAARTAMLKQTELSSADRIGIAPSHIWVPADLQETAWNLFQRGTNLDKTFVQSMLLNIHTVWYWTDVTDWALSADTNDIPGIEVGFIDGQQEPEVFVQDMPNVGSMFTNDKVTYKIRHMYGGTVKDFRGWYKEVVAG